LFGNCTPPGLACAGSPPCQDPSFRLPVLTYSHSAACSITGGYVYRGCRMENYRGTYFYGDFCAAFVRTFVMSGGVATSQTDVTNEVNTGFGDVSSFGVDGEGEMYVVELGGIGTVHKIMPPFVDLEVSARGAANQLLLSKTGDWIWEDLFQTSDVPVSFYRVYRGSVNGAYNCVFKTTTARWPSGGDPITPAPGQLFTYVVTAVNSSRVETDYGTTGSFNASTCP
jgi:hypothetical protein